jgi:hypothetical protein
VRLGILRCTVITALAAGATLAFAFSTGPPASKTGAPAIAGVAAEGICRECHSTFPLNTAGATLEILDVPQSYLPDTLYTLRVRMTSTFAAPRRWGFQVTAVRATDGQGAGTFDIAGIAGLQVVLGAGGFASRRYVEHNSNGTFDNNLGPVEWTLRWRAPKPAAGRIFFFVAGNAANSNDLNTGDHIYTSRDTTDASPLLDAPSPPLSGLDVLESALPNPFRTVTTLRYALARAGRAELAIFDAQGRIVRTLVNREQPAGRGSATWDGGTNGGGSAAPGLYFARLSAPGLEAPLTRRVVLTR